MPSSLLTGDHESAGAPPSTTSTAPQLIASSSSAKMVSEPRVMRLSRHKRNNSTDALPLKPLLAAHHRRSNSINMTSQSPPRSSSSTSTTLPSTSATTTSLVEEDVDSETNTIGSLTTQLPPSSSSSEYPSNDNTTSAKFSTEDETTTGVTTTPSEGILFSNNDTLMIMSPVPETSTLHAVDQSALPPSTLTHFTPGYEMDLQLSSHIMQPKANMTVSHKLGHRRGYSLTDFRRTMPPPPSVVFFDHRQHATAADGPSQNPGLPQRSQSSLGHRRGSSWTPIPTSTSTPPPRPTYSSSNHMIIAGDLFNGGVDPMHHRQPLSLNLNFSAFGNDLSMETLSSAHASPTSPFVNGSFLPPPASPHNNSPMSPNFSFQSSDTSSNHGLSMNKSPHLHLASPIPYSHSTSSQHQLLPNQQLQQQPSSFHLYPHHPHHHYQHHHPSLQFKHNNPPNGYQDGIIQDLVNMRLQRNGSVDFSVMGTAPPLFHHHYQQQQQDPGSANCSGGDGVGGSVAMDMSNMSIPIPMRIQQAHGVGMQMNMMDQASSSSSSASSAASADFLHRGGSKPLGMDSPHPPKYDTFSSLGVNVSVSAWNPSSATGETVKDSEDRPPHGVSKGSSLSNNIKVEEDDTDQVLQCLWNDCRLQFTSTKELVGHVNDDHIGIKKPAYFCEWSFCTRVKKPFTKRHKLSQHMRTHTGEKPYVCPTPGCGKKFARQDGLNTHTKIHLDYRPFTCDFPDCNKAYFHSRSLRKHFRMHEEGRASEHVSDNEDADDENEQQEESQQLLPFAAKLEPSSTSIDITGSEQLSLQEQRNQQQILANAIYPPSEIENALLAYQHQSNYQQQQQQHMQHLGMEFETMKHMNSNQLRFVPTPPFTPPPPPPHLQEHDWMMTGNHFYST